MSDREGSEVRQLAFTVGAAATAVMAGQLVGEHARLVLVLLGYLLTLAALTLATLGARGLLASD